MPTVYIKIRYKNVLYFNKYTMEYNAVLYYN